MSHFVHRPTTYLLQSANSCVAACYVSMLQVNCFMPSIAEILSVVKILFAFVLLQLCSFQSIFEFLLFFLFYILVFVIALIAR